MSNVSPTNMQDWMRQTTKTASIQSRRGNPFFRLGVVEDQLATFSHRNKLINSAFVVNQRGATSPAVLGARQFAFDRWAASGITNYMLNPVIGTATTGWVSNSAGLTLSRVASDPGVSGVSGLASFARLTATTTVAIGTGFIGNTGNTAVTGLVANTPVRVSVYVRSSKIQRIGMVGIWQNSGGADTSATSWAAQIVLAANVWTRVDVLDRVPVGSAGIRFGVSSIAGTSASTWLTGDTFDFVAGMVTMGSALWPFHFGGSADCAWAGTVDASYSVRGPATTTLTWTSDTHGQPCTITSGGGLSQVIERTEIEAGSYEVSWTGDVSVRVYNVGTAPGALPAFATGGSFSVILDGLDDVVTEVRAVGADRVFHKAQLEHSTFATPFDNRFYSTELALCQRFYWRYNNPSTSTLTIMVCGVAWFTTSFLYGELHFPVEMRTIPISSSVSANGAAALTIFWQAVSTNSTSAQLTAFSTTRARLEAVTASAGTAGNAAWLELRPGFYIEVNSELF